jgi:hypothetical protein
MHARTHGAAVIITRQHQSEKMIAERGHERSCRFYTKYLRARVRMCNGASGNVETIMTSTSSRPLGAVFTVSVFEAHSDETSAHNFLTKLRACTLTGLSIDFSPS